MNFPSGWDRVKHSPADEPWYHNCYKSYLRALACNPGRYFAPFSTPNKAPVSVGVDTDMRSATHTGHSHAASKCWSKIVGTIIIITTVLVKRKNCFENRFPLQYVTTRLRSCSPLPPCCMPLLNTSQRCRNVMCFGPSNIPTFEGTV